MAYEAQRDEDLEKMRNDQNNANNIRNAADVAIASKNPYAMAAGAAVKAADKISGGKSTEALGKGMTKANNMTPGGKRIQDASNKLSESGASDAAGRAASMKNGMAAKGASGDTPNQVVHSGGGEQNGSLPSSVEKKQLPPGNASGISAESGAAASSEAGAAGVVAGEDSSKEKDSGGSNSDQGGSDDDKKSGKGALSFLGKQALVAVLIMTLPAIILFMSFLIVLSAASGVFGEYRLRKRKHLYV